MQPVDGGSNSLEMLEQINHSTRRKKPEEQPLRELSLAMKTFELLFTQVMESISSWSENDTALISRKHSRLNEREPRPAAFERLFISSYQSAIAPIIA
jgi:DNA-binding HxlR family transcriptional regulator